MRNSKSEARLGRVNEELRKALSQIIDYEVKNSNVTGMISVTKVKVTPDLKYAKVYVSILNLRITPEIVFEYDDSIEHGERIESLLQEIKKQDEKIKNK